MQGQCRHCGHGGGTEKGQWGLAGVSGGIERVNGGIGQGQWGY